MPFFYSNPERETEPHALPDVEVFFEYGNEEQESGYYYWYCMPGYMPDSDPFGPFETMEAAVADAREQND